MIPCIKNYSRLVSFLKYKTPVKHYSLRPSTVRDDPSDTIPYEGKSFQPLKRKPQREPFLKNIIVAKYDVDMLVYPEILDLDRLKHIDHLSDIVNNFWSDEVHKDPKYFINGVPPSFIEQITNFGLFKQKIPYSHNGFDFSATESAKINEIMGRNILSSNVVSSQNVIHEILASASEEIKDKYFSKIIKENWKGSICLSEVKSEFDIREGETTIIWSETENSYVLKGHKIWVLNANTADFFIVLGKCIDHGHEKAIYCAVLVDKEKSGIKINKHVDNQYHIVEFDNVKVDESDIIISKSKGLEIASKIKQANMFNYASSIVGMTKDIFDHTTHFCMNSSFLGKYNSDAQVTQVALSYLSSDIYVLESMIYHVANLMDGYENQDCEVETAVLKVLASQTSLNVINECINILGPHVTMNSYGYPYFENLLYLKRLSLLNMNDDHLKIFISIKCLEHNKEHLSEYIKRIRKPQFHFADAMKHQLFLVKNEKDVPKLNLNFYMNLHPSLKECADVLEYSVKRTEYANIRLLEHYAADTYDNHFALLRLANLIIDIYSMTSLLSRASRSYCTGIQHCDFEIKAAQLYCYEVQKRVKKNVAEIVDGPHCENVTLSKDIAEKILDTKGYHMQHPLARNII